MKQKFSILILGLVILFTSCGPKVYEGKSGFEKTIVRDHETLAILPFGVSVETKKLRDEIPSATLDYSNKELGYIAQKNVYISFLDQFGKKKYNVDFQDIDQTNALLRKNHIQYDDLQARDKSELCILLGVDGIVLGNVHSAKLLENESETASTDSRRRIPNKINSSIGIYDQRDGQLVWDYNYDVPTIPGNTIQSVIRAMMDNISSKFPYKKK